MTKQDPFCLRKIPLETKPLDTTGYARAAAAVAKRKRVSDAFLLTISIGGLILTLASLASTIAFGA